MSSSIMSGGILSGGILSGSPEKYHHHHHHHTLHVLARLWQRNRTMLLEFCKRSSILSGYGWAGCALNRKKYKKNFFITDNHYSSEKTVANRGFCKGVWGKVSKWSVGLGRNPKKTTLWSEASGDWAVLISNFASKNSNVAYHIISVSRPVPKQRGRAPPLNRLLGETEKQTTHCEY